MSKTIVKLKNDNYEDIRIDNRSIQRDMIIAILASNYTLTKTKEYELLPLTKFNAVGNKLSVDENGNVVIGEGVNKIKVTLKVLFFSVASTGTKYLTIRKESNGNTLAYSRKNIQNAPDTLELTDIIINVSEGDTIGEYVYSESLDTLDGLANYPRTYMTVEVIE